MIIIVGIGSFLLAAVVRWWMTRTYKIWGGVANRIGAHGHATARHILDSNGLQHVTLERSKGQLSDHYIPARDLIRLSPSVSDKASVASLAVAAHEVGHALQKHTEYWPLRAKAMLMPMAAAGHRFGLLLMMGGGLGGLPVLLNLGVVMLTGAVLVQLLTLPIEFDASRRALDELTRLKLVDEQELSGAKTMLTAAALTYVASAASSLAVVGVLMLSFLRRR
jgi:Zn-dependent membrane protease YugP